MTFLDLEEEHQSPPIYCNFIPSSLKEAFAQCHAFPIGRPSSPSTEEESPASDIEDQRVIVLAVRSRAKRANLRRKESLRCNSFRWWVLSPAVAELFITPKAEEREEHNGDDNDGQESFYSVKSCFSRCCSSTVEIDSQEIRRRSIVEEFSHCEGWPFGLYRKALMLPPLPRSPADSWLWRRGTGHTIIKMP